MSLPDGTVTLLFTDIEDSTRLVHELGGGYTPVLEAHREAIRSAVDAAGGCEVECRADELFAAFGDAVAAVGAAVAAQRALAREPWPPGHPVRVRMGVHTGRPTPAGSSYVGVDVHRAARICAAAHGGQILVSADTASVVGGAVTLVDLGEHTLRGLPTPDRLLQVVADGLPREFPPLNAIRAPGGRRRRVVLADDSVLLREGIARLLEDAGFDVAAQFGTADDLLRHVDVQAPDVAIVDLRMPPTKTDEGLRAAQQIRERHPGVGVLLLSQYVEPAYARELLAAGRTGVGYLLKDRVADVDEFAAAVRLVADGGCALDPEL